MIHLLKKSRKESRSGLQQATGSKFHSRGFGCDWGGGGNLEGIDEKRRELLETNKHCFKRARANL